MSAITSNSGTCLKTDWEISDTALPDRALPLQGDYNQLLASKRRRLKETNVFQQACLAVRLLQACLHTFLNFSSASLSCKM